MAARYVYESRVYGITVYCSNKILFLLEVVILCAQYIKKVSPGGTAGAL